MDVRKAFAQEAHRFLLHRLRSAERIEIDLIGRNKYFRVLSPFSAYFSLFTQMVVQNGPQLTL